MARQKTKNCLYCHSSFLGRRNAKTCSDRCRKALQRARDLFEKDVIKQLDAGQLDGHVGLAKVVGGRAR